MYEILNFNPYRNSCMYKKILRAMKLTIVIILLTLLQVSASGFAQNRITLSRKNAPMGKILNDIRTQSGYDVLFIRKDIKLAKPVSINVNNASLEETLKQVFANQPLEYVIEAETIVVMEKKSLPETQRTEAVNIDITGKVVDETDQGVPGVTVKVKAGTQGTITDINGSFSLKNVNENAVLVISSIGYITQEITARSQSFLIKLVAKPSDLSEVVVVGYGTQKKVNVTGAVDQISGKQLAERPIANVLQGLQGLTPGLNIGYSGGRPGATPSINVRGITTLTGGGASPLIVIDGIASTNDDLLRLNPIDIGSVTVLRDAASAAIYGARASFGVILITTKQGASNGKQNISYNNYFSLSRRTVMPDMVTDPYIYSRVLETSTDNSPWDYVNYSDYHYQWAKERSDNPSVEDIRIDPNDPNRWMYMGSNNWNDYFFNKTNLSQNHSMSFSGGSDIGQGRPFGYLISTDYTKENGLNKLTKDDWNRYGLRARLNFTPLNWLKVDNNLNIYQTVTAAPSNSITNLYYLQPTDVAKNPDGTWANTGAGRLSAQLSGESRNDENRFGFQNIFRGVASFLNNDLQVTGSASLKRELWKYNTNFNKYKIGYGPNDIREEGGSGSVAFRDGNVKHDVYDLYANYTKRLGNDHEFKLLGGYNQEEYIWAYQGASRDVLISSSLPYVSLTTGTAAITSDYTTYALRSVFGRFNYAYKGRYIVEANGRYDGSSRFPNERRWGFFPSVSAAWIASEEPFFEAISKQIPTLKFRASFGDLGNQSVSDFGYIQTLPTGRSAYLINNAFPTVISGAPQLRVDPNNYTWERVTTFNAGTDVGLFDNKIELGFDYYKRNTIGMLGPVAELPGVLGTAAPNQNVADLATQGWELSAGFRNNFSIAAKPLSLRTRFTLSDSRTRITKYKNDQLLLNNYRVGQYTGEIWGLENDGFFKTRDEINKLDQSAVVPWGALEIVEGWPKYMDQNQDGKITLGNTQTKPGDLKMIGNSSTRYRFGLNMDMSWSNFDLSFFLQGVAKKDFYPHHYLYWGPYQQPYAGIYPWNLDFYRGVSETGTDRERHSASYIAAGLADANTTAGFPVLQAWMADNNYGAGLDIPQTKYMLNGAYLRVKNLTFGYTLPATLTKRYKISRFRIFVTGENLFEFSEIKKYFDPEAIADGYGWAYPFQRKYAAGINLNF